MTEILRGNRAALIAAAILGLGIVIGGYLLGDGLRRARMADRAVTMRGLAEQADNFVGMELTDPAVDFVGLARSLGIAAERTTTVKDTTDLIARALKDNTALLIDVAMDRGYKPM